MSLNTAITLNAILDLGVVLALEAITLVTFTLDRREDERTCPHSRPRCPNTSPWRRVRSLLDEVATVIEEHKGSPGPRSVAGRKC